MVLCLNFSPHQYVLLFQRLMMHYALWKRNCCFSEGKTTQIKKLNPPIWLTKASLKGFLSAYTLSYCNLYACEQTDMITWEVSKFNSVVLGEFGHFFGQPLMVFSGNSYNN